MISRAMLTLLARLLPGVVHARLAGVDLCAGGREQIVGPLLVKGSCCVIGEIGRCGRSVRLAANNLCRAGRDDLVDIAQMIGAVCDGAEIAMWNISDGEKHHQISNLGLPFDTDTDAFGGLDLALS